MDVCVFVCVCVAAVSFLRGMVTVSPPRSLQSSHNSPIPHCQRLNVCGFETSTFKRYETHQPSFILRWWAGVRVLELKVFKHSRCKSPYYHIQYLGYDRCFKSQQRFFFCHFCVTYKFIGPSVKVLINYDWPELSLLIWGSMIGWCVCSEWWKCETIALHFMVVSSTNS